MIEIKKNKIEYHQNYGIEIKKRKIEYIGQWRKDVAIGYMKDPIYHHYVPLLISKNNEILFECYACSEYTEEIYRTSRGYYIVTGYRDCSAPGKDPVYSGPIILRIIDESGRKEIHDCNIKYDSNTGEWFDPNDADFFIPKDMGVGIVENKGSFYSLDNFEKIFEIPQKYKLESVFDQGLCLLSVPEDNRDFIVMVKNKEIVDFLDVNNENKLFNLIDRTGDTSLVNYSNNDSSYAIKVLKKQLKTIKEQKNSKKEQRLEKINYYSSYTYPRHYISKELTTIEDFKNEIKISEQELKLLQELHKTLCNEDLDKKEKISFHLRENRRAPDNCLECLFYTDYMILRIKGEFGLVMNRFYSLNGHPLSNKIYFNINPIIKNSPTRNNNYFNNHYFTYGQKKDSGILIISGDKIVESPFPDIMYDKDRYFYNLSVHENYISFKEEYYDYFYRKLPVKYTDVKLEEVIRNYLYKMTPDFEVSMWADQFTCGNVRFMLGGYIAKEKFMKGSVYLPLPSRLDSIQNELSYKYKNCPNHVDRVIFIGDYENETEGKFSLYLFNCRPHGYCDTKGRIFYDFNPDEVTL